MTDLERAQQTIRKLRRELQFAYANNHKRNLELDALHYVWCDGGCESGVHRWEGGPLTAEVVELAVQNTERLVRWRNNYATKQTYKK